MNEHSRRVLVVDDDDAIRVMIERVLRSHHFAVDTATDGFEAIQKIVKNDYASILLDLSMPRVDGVGVLRFLQEKRPELERAVIIVTADVPRATEVAGAAGVRILAKPFDIVELLAELRSDAKA